MGFLSGSMTFDRFRVTEDKTGEFGEEHLAILKKNQIKPGKTNLYESPSTGFTGGAHLFDTDFDHAKNIIGEAMHFGIRTDSCQIPGPIKNAWMQMELAGVLKETQGSRPSKAQREEAKEAVEARCADEADKGNFIRMSVIPVLWDAATETIFLGTTSEKAQENCLQLLTSSFGIEFQKVTSSLLALEFATTEEQTKALFAVNPAHFLPDSTGTVTWWNGMGDNYDYLGNEFLLWLWWHWESDSDTIPLSDGTELTGMFARSLALDCPAGENGKESISSESPVALPEARMAIRMGKLPRKAGLRLVRDDEQFDLTLKAETFSVGSARISQVGDDTPIRESLDRIESIRQLVESMDLLYEVFCAIRLGKKWPATLKEIAKWLQADPPLRKQSSQTE